MPGIDTDFERDLAELRSVTTRIFTRYPVSALNQSATIEAAFGSLEVLLGGWDGSKWVTKPIKTLSPNESCSAKLNTVNEGDLKSGEYLIMRAKDSSVAFKIKNNEKYIGLLKKTSPESFPWWEKSSVIDNDWIDANGEKVLLISPGVQYSFYYFRVS